MAGDARHGEWATTGHRDTPTRLPFELLHAIFLLAATPPTSRGPRHGGSVRSWHSCEAAAPYALVCRAWRKPAQTVLFSSVALVGHRRALAFAEAAALPSFGALASKTASVVLALDAAAEGTADDAHGQLETSELLVTALEHCSTASHVCIRPLHRCVRDRLLATLMSPDRTLVTLILRPRTFASVNWTGQLWHASDALQLRPTVQNLEHTTLMTPYPTPPDSATSSPRASRAAEHAPLFDKLALRRVKVWYDFPGEVLADAFLRSPQLEYLDLYFERRKPTDLFVQALKASAHSLREIRYICASALHASRSWPAPSREINRADLVDTSPQTTPPRPSLTTKARRPRAHRRRRRVRAQTARSRSSTSSCRTSRRSGLSAAARRT